MALKESINGNNHNGSNGNGNGNLILIDERAKHINRRTAVRCTIYLLFMLAVFGWLLFDTWIEKHSIARILGYDLARLNNSGFRLVAFTVIAGGLGGAVNGIRSLIRYTETFCHKHRWKYISAPWMGSTLALLVYAILRSSIAVLGGNISPTGIGSTQVLANFAAGGLAGYGAKDVFIWLDDKVHKIFHVPVPEKTPDVTGKSQALAVSRIEAAQLELGQVSKVQQRKGKPAGTVLDQSPPPEASIDRGQSVDLIVAADGNSRPQNGA